MLLYFEGFLFILGLLSFFCLSLAQVTQVVNNPALKSWSRNLHPGFLGLWASFCFATPVLSRQSNTFWVVFIVRLPFSLICFISPPSTDWQTQPRTLTWPLLSQSSWKLFVFISILIRNHSYTHIHTPTLGWTNREMYRLCSLQLHPSPLSPPLQFTTFYPSIIPSRSFSPLLLHLLYCPTHLLPPPLSCLSLLSFMISSL